MHAKCKQSVHTIIGVHYQWANTAQSENPLSDQPSRRGGERGGVAHVVDGTCLSGIPKRGTYKLRPDFTRLFGHELPVRRCKTRLQFVVVLVVGLPALSICNYAMYLTCFFFFF